MMTRTLDVDLVNEIANHPDVRPFLGGFPGTFADLGPLMVSPGTLTYWMPGAAFVLPSIGDGVYLAHSLFLPEARRYSRRAMRETAQSVFEAGAKEIWTMVAETNKAAMALTRLGGFSQIGFCERMFPVPGGPVAMSYWALTYEAWAAKRGSEPCQP